MANEQKITEIVSEAAFAQLDKLYAELGKNADQFAKYAAAILDANKEITNAKSFGEVEKALEKQVLSEQRIAKAKAQTLLAEEKLAQAKLKTVEIAERAAKRQADAEYKAQQAAASAARAQEIASKATKDAADSAYNANMQTVVSEKAKEQAAKAAEAVARSAAAAEAQRQKDAAKAALDQQKSFKINADLITKENDILASYGTTRDALINQGIELRAELKSLNDQFKEVGKNASAEQIRDYTEAQQLLKIAISQNQTETKRLIKEQASAEGSYERLDARLNSLRAEYKKLSREERETSEAAKLMEQEIKDLDKELKDLDATLGVHNRHVGDYQRGLGLLPPLVQNIVDSMQDWRDENGKLTFRSITDGIIGMTRAALAFIATPIGAAITALAVALGGAKAFYEYNKGLEEATRLTRQFTDLAGDDLVDLRTQVESIASVYDKDFREVLTSVVATAKNFGLSYQESLDLVKDGFIAGADASGDFLNQLKEYPTQLESVGLSAEQTISLITQNVKEGIFSDKGIDAIKEAGLSLREMTKASRDALTGIGLDSRKIEKDLLEGNKTVFQVIQEISARLSELPPQSAAVGTAIADIFKGAGEDAGLRYLTTLQDIDLELSGLVEQQGELGEAQRIQLQATEELKSTMASLFDITGGGFELLIANAKLFATDLLIQMIRGIVSFYNGFVDVYNGSKLFRGILAGIGVTFKTLIGISKLFFDFVYNGAATFGNIFKAIITGNFADLGNIVKNGLKSNLTDLKIFGNNLGDAFIDGFDSTIAGRLSTIDLTRNVGGDLGISQGTGQRSGGRSGALSTDADDKKAADKAAKEAAKLAEEQAKRKMALENRMLQLTVDRLKKEEAALRRSSDFALEIASDELNGYDDRLSNLQYFLEKRQEEINKAEEREMAENSKAMIEVRELQRKASIETNAQIKSDLLAEADSLRTITVERDAEIQQAANDERLKLAKQGNALIKNIYQQDAEQQIEGVYNVLTQQADKANVALAQQFAKGAISEADYAKQREGISRKLTTDLINNEIKATQTAIDLAKAKGINVSDQERQLAALKVRLSGEVADQQISDLEKVAEREKQLKDLRMELGQELANATFSILNGIIEKDIQRIELRQEDLEKQKETELASLEFQKLTDQQKAEARFGIEQNYAQKEQQLEDQKARMRQKQAKLERAQNVLSIVGNTAVSIMRAFADLGPIAGIPFAAIIGAIGAAQLVSVLAKPLPQYYKGVQSSPEGFAKVGERGTEMRIDPDGKMSLTPGKETITYLQKGTQIIPHEQTKRILAKKSLEGFDGGSVSYVNFDKMIQESKRSTKEIAGAVGKSRSFGTIVTKKGFTHQSFRAMSLKNWQKRNGI